jgi:DNA mismatch repair ATPase MutS
MKMEDLATLEADEKRTIVYLYRIKPGFSLSSFALECAKSIIHDRFFAQRSVAVLNSFLKRDKVEPLESVQRDFKHNVAKILDQLGSVLH